MDVTEEGTVRTGRLTGRVCAKRTIYLVAVLSVTNA